VADDDATARLYTDQLLRLANERVREAPLERVDADGEELNAFCGDVAEVSLAVEAATGRLAVRVEVHGCAISRAAATLVHRLATGTDAAGAASLVATARTYLVAGADETPPPPGFEALAGVRSFPGRLRCALTPWVALERALDEG